MNAYVQDRTPTEVPNLEPSMYAALEAHLDRPVRGQLIWDETGVSFLTTDNEEIPLVFDEPTKCWFVDEAES